MRRQPRRTVLDRIAQALDAHSRETEPQTERPRTVVPQRAPIQTTADWVEARKRWVAGNRKGEGE